MKSKEEILEKHQALDIDSSSGDYIYKESDVLQAMEEYANQFKQPEKKSIEDRKAEFVADVREIININWIEISVGSIVDFLDYWTEISPNGKKMRFEKEKVFDIKKRLERWIRNQKTFNNGKSVTETRFEQHSSGFDKMFNSTTNP